MSLNDFPILCLDEIFEILYKDGLLKGLSNCALVNKQWYVLVIPKLWRHPFYPSRTIFKKSCINSIIPFLPPLTCKNNKFVNLSLNHAHGYHDNDNRDHTDRDYHKPFYNYLQHLQIFDLARIETDSRYWIDEKI